MRRLSLIAASAALLVGGCQSPDDRLTDRAFQACGNLGVASINYDNPESFVCREAVSDDH